MQVDLKPEELYKYNGSSPCPDDIDEFWDRSIREMEAIDPQTELIPAEIQFKNAELFHLYYTGIDGSRIYAKYVRPQNSKNAPVVFLFHGYSGSSPKDWFSLMNYVSQGFCVAALDCRGQAGLSEDLGGTRGNTLHGQIIRGLDSDSPDDLLFRKIFLDTAQLVRIVEKFDEVDKEKMFTYGGSQGGALSLACAALSPQIKKTATCYPFLCDYRRVWEMDMDERAYVELKEYFRMFDPRHEREDEIFMRLGYIDVQNIAHRIKAEVTMFTGLMDNVCPPSTQFAAFNKITSPKRVIFYPDFGHEGLPGCGDTVITWFEEAK